MDLRKAYQEKVEAQFKEWGSQLEALKQKTQNRLADVKVAMAEKVQDLSVKYEEAKTKWEQVKQTSGDRFEGMKAGFEQSLQEVKEAFRNRGSGDKKGEI